MATFTKADDPDLALLRWVKENHHERLQSAGVTVGLLYAFASQDDSGATKGPALKLHGQPCWAIVKINSLQDRVEGKPDATIRLDGDRWPEVHHETKVAILDHELAHLLVEHEKAEKGGRMKVDDCGRPLLKMRMHDLVVEGFSDVVMRHGARAVESQHYLEVHRFFSQQTFPWG